MILAEVPINPEIIFVLLALIASGVKTYFDRKNAKSPEGEGDDNDLYDQYRDEIARKQRAQPQAEVWPKREPTRRADRHSPRPQTPLDQVSPPPFPTPNRQATHVNPATISQPHLTKIAPPKLNAAEQKALSNFQKNNGLKNSPITNSKITRQRPSALRKVLSDPDSIKQAIVLNEILGKPKGLATK